MTVPQATTLALASILQKNPRSFNHALGNLKNDWNTDMTRRVIALAHMNVISRALKSPKQLSVASVFGYGRLASDSVQSV